MIKISSLFEVFEKNQANLIKRVPHVEHIISIYYGYSKKGSYRLALKSTIEPFFSKSTKVIEYSIVKINTNEFWSYFDLNDERFIPIFYKFIESIIETILVDKNEQNALTSTQNLFELWKKMFEKKQVEMSIEKAQGLFGELYTLTNIPLNKELNVSLDDVILGWGGGENLTKDFSFKDTWIEVKTRKSNTDKIRITRIEQLESSTKGFLSVVTVEIMSEIYNIKPSSIKELVQSILDSIQSPLIKSKFLEKLDLYGYDFLQEVVEKKFCIINLSMYTVDEKFPRLNRSDFDKPEILEVAYTLSINSIERFKVQKWN
jgi:hypothetical protein